MCQLPLFSNITDPFGIQDTLHLYSTNTPSLSDIQVLQLTPTWNLSSLSISPVLIYSEGRDGIHYLFHTDPSLALANASQAQ